MTQNNPKIIATMIIFSLSAPIDSINNIKNTTKNIKLKIIPQQIH